MPTISQATFNSTNYGVLAALGTSQGTAAQIIRQFTKVTGADGTKGGAFAHLGLASRVTSASVGRIASCQRRIRAGLV